MSRYERRKLKKVCVFCGTDLGSGRGNAEHIIPQWLLRYTAGPESTKEGNRKMWTLDRSRSRIVGSSWMRQTVRSCIDCNGRFGSTLETQASSAIKNLLSLKPLCAKDWNIILDWFDKVRIGLWYQALVSHETPLGIDPHFAIGQRIAQRDRLLLIYRFHEIKTGIGLVGTTTNKFMMMPSCFGLAINSFYFINVSAEFLLSKGMGFPHPDPEKTVFFYGSDAKIIYPTDGTKTIATKPVALDWDPRCSEVFQTMFKETQNKKPELYNHQFHDDNSLDKTNGVGYPFINSKGSLQKAPLTPDDNWSPRQALVFSEAREIVKLIVAEIQRRLCTDPSICPHWSHFTPPIPNNK